MANDKINYSAKIEEMLTEMPDFIADFIYNFGHTEQFATKFEYCRDIRDFLRFLINATPEHCDKEVREITITDLANIDTLTINRYLTILQGSDVALKPTTVKRRRATLSSMYGFFVSTGKMDRNPVAATKTIHIPEKNVIFLTNEEQSILLDTVRNGTYLTDKAAKVHNKYENRDSAMFLLLLDTGLRVSEMLATDIVDYNLDDCSVIVMRKGGDIDTVYFSDECAQYLLSYFSAQRVRFSLPDDEIPAFTTTSGNRLGVRAVEKLVKKYVAACLPEKEKIISPHKLRSSFAMSFYEASDNNILLLQKRMHHKNIATTNIYAKAASTEVKDSRNLLQNRR